MSLIKGPPISDEVWNKVKLERSVFQPDVRVTQQQFDKAWRDLRMSETIKAQNLGRPLFNHYWGLYCPQCNVWLTDKDTVIIHYPSPYIVEAFLKEDPTPKEPNWRDFHLWEVTEFGEQKRIYPTEPGIEVCPMRR